VLPRPWWFEPVLPALFVSRGMLMGNASKTVPEWPTTGSLTRVKQRSSKHGVRWPMPERLVGGMPLPLPLSPGLLQSLAAQRQVILLLENCFSKIMLLASFFLS
jgi:hypothetical protein